MAADKELLKKWIQENMTSDAASELDLHKEQVARLLTLTPSGGVLVRVDRNRLDLPSEILLQLIGRAYASAAGLVSSDAMTAKELGQAVKGTAGGQRWALSYLANKSMITPIGRGSYRVPAGQIKFALDRIAAKVLK